MASPRAAVPSWHDAGLLARAPSLAAPLLRAVDLRTLREELALRACCGRPARLAACGQPDRLAPAVMSRWSAARSRSRHQAIAQIGAIARCVASWSVPLRGSS